jgi:hypothetical protein
MRHSPELIVPIRDRRSRHRILTLKNFAKVVIALGIFFAGLTIQSDFRHPNSSAEYGRLLDKQVSSHDVIEAKKDQIITAPIEDQTAADPLLVAAQAREQWLHQETPAPVAQTDSSSVSGPSGIVIVRGKIDQRHPVLSGGIFRQ